MAVTTIKPVRGQRASAIAEKEDVEGTVVAKQIHGRAVEVAVMDLRAYNPPEICPAVGNSLVPVSTSLIAP